MPELLHWRISICGWAVVMKRFNFLQKMRLNHNKEYYRILTMKNW
jgi:hypothetical protein